VGRKVALIAGGIGFDVAELLTHPGDSPDPIAAYREEWGIDAAYTDNRAASPRRPMPTPVRELWLLQRKTGKLGAGLAKTTGWARSLLLKKRGVYMLGGAEHVGIDDAGLHTGGRAGPPAGGGYHRAVRRQEPRRELAEGLTAAGMPFTLVGGADVAAELDAKRAIWQATEFARQF
jgi:2,4-dienoyl-CoA reductase (NADPH2)